MVLVDESQTICQTFPLYGNTDTTSESPVTSSVMINAIRSFTDGTLCLSGSYEVVEKKFLMNIKLDTILIAMLTQLAKISPVLPHNPVSTYDANK